jgi:hypothetical protein
VILEVVSLDLLSIVQSVALVRLNLRLRVRLVRLAGDGWLVLICCERKILLASWWLLAGAKSV